LGHDWFGMRGDGLQNSFSICSQAFHRMTIARMPPTTNNAGKTKQLAQDMKHQAGLVKLVAGFSRLVAEPARNAPIA
jgi:hypothetical protein